MASKKVYRNGKVHVMKHMCASCIFRPGNLMRLEDGRVNQMVKDATKAQSCIPCHQTTFGQAKGNAVCRGFFEQHPTASLQVAQRLGFVIYQEL